MKLTTFRVIVYMATSFFFFFFKGSCSVNFQGVPFVVKWKQSRNTGRYSYIEESRRFF